MTQTPPNDSYGVLAAIRRSRVITVDQNAGYPPAFDASSRRRRSQRICQLRQCKYLNNMGEQDHRSVKRRMNPGLGVWGVHHGTADHPGRWSHAYAP